MKAILFPKYGSPDVLELTEVAKPSPQDDQVLIKIKAASANPLDWHRMRGAPFLVRLSDGFLKPKDPTIGVDIAGVVEAVGKDAHQFKVGDEVFGCIDNGGFAEYTVTREKNLALKPANISFEEAAAVPVAAFTALQGLRDKGQIQAGQKVLINGASGGVGTYAVQMAKSFGAEVTGVCSTRNLELVRSIGADHVIDYTQENFTKGSQRYDLIFDVAANHSVADFKRVLTPQGKAVMAGFGGMIHIFQFIILGALASKKDGQQIGLMGTAQPNQADLLVIQEFLASGKVVSVIDKQYPMHQTAEAIRYLETGRARGKVIITI